MHAITGGGSVQYKRFTTSDSFDYVASTSGTHCYPLSGGSTSLITYSTSSLDISVSHVGNTSFGAAPCDTSGNYYVNFKNNNTGQNYYGQYYFNAEAGQVTLSSSTPLSICDGTSTQICDIKPEEGTTTSNSVLFSLDAFINPEDVGTIEGFRVTLHNIDQNVFLYSALSPYDIQLLNVIVNTGGQYSFSSTTILADGNYRIEACLTRSYWGIFTNPYSSDSDCQSHQFIVNQATFIGSVSQTVWGQTQQFFGTQTGTSSAALASSCNPVSGNFDIRNCLAFLLVPDGAALNQTLESAKQGIFTRFPWGYLTRTIQIFGDAATTSLPSFDAQFQVGPGSETPEIETLSFDIGDMLTGGSALVDSIQDPLYGKTVKDVFEPWIRLLVALAILLVVIFDITGIGKHNDNEPKNHSNNKNKV